MHQNVLDLDGSAGTLILACYVVGGLIAAAAGLLPGNAPRFRILCVLLGLALSAWAVKVLLVGGVIILSLGVLLLPLTLTVRAIIGTYRAYRPRRGANHSGPLRPHPATRTYREPTSLPASPSFPDASLAAAHASPDAGHSAVNSAHEATRTQPRSAGATQPRFHGHAIAPPATFPTPPRFAPQPLHNVPSPRSAPDGYATVHAQYPASHAQPQPASHAQASQPHRSSQPHQSSQPHRSSQPHQASQAPAWQQASTWPQDRSWSRGAVEGRRVPVPRQNVTTTTPTHAVASSTRMALAPVTDPSPLQPSAVRARHRAAGSTG